MTLPSVTKSIALTGARLRTNVDDDSSPTALLIENGKITALGSDDDIRAMRPEGTEIIAAGGATVTPGLWDSHAHPHTGAVSTRGIDLGGISFLEDLRYRLKAAHQQLEPGAWLEGWNLEYEMFEDTGIDRRTFEDVVGERPTFLRFYDGHTGLASLPALQSAEITEPIIYPDGSMTVTDESGRLTGELREMSILSYITEKAPAPDPEVELSAFEDVLLKFASTGLTGCAIMDGNPRTREVLRELEKRGRLPQRITVHEWHKVHYTDDDQQRIIDSKDERGRLWQGGAIKLFSDGVIDTGTALLHQPDTHGCGTSAAWPDWDRFRSVIHRYHDAGMQMAIHAVGDRAVSDVLDVYAELEPRSPGGAAHSIEHLEVMAEDDVRKLGSSGITASMQPLHMQWRQPDFNDNWAERLGQDRRSTGYRCRSAIDAGARVVLGSDWPVADYDPRTGLAWARGRHSPGHGDSHAFEPEEALSGEEALLAYTLWPAAARGWTDRGRLAVGAVGDLTVFAEDPVTASSEQLAELPILMTIVDGMVVYRNSMFQK